MDVKCAICLEHKQVLQMNCCSAQFCDGCLKGWFMRNKSCPYCRSKIYRVYFAGKADPLFRKKEDIMHYINNDNVVSNNGYNYDKGWDVIDDIQSYEGSVIKGSYIYNGPFMYKKILSDIVENDECNHLDYDVIHGNPSDDCIQHVCWSGGGNTHHAIVERCNEEIQECDVFIMYLDPKISCYGTILEFGRALEAKKLCILILPDFDSKTQKEKFCKEVWFLIYQEIKHLKDEQKKWDIHERHIFRTVPQLKNRWKDLKDYKKYLERLH